MIETLPREILGHVGTFLDADEKTKCYQAAKCFDSIFYSQEEYVIEINENTVETFLTRVYRLVAMIVKKRMPNLKYVTFDITMVVDVNVGHIVNYFRFAIPHIKFRAIIKSCRHPDRIIRWLPNGTEIDLIHNFVGSEINIPFMLGKQYTHMKMGALSSSTSMALALGSKELMDSVQTLEILMNTSLDLTNIDSSKTYVVVDYFSADACELPHKDLYKVRKLIMKTHQIQYMLTSLQQDSHYTKRALLENVELVCYDHETVTHDIDAFLKWIPKATIFTLCSSYGNMCPATFFVANILLSNGWQFRFKVNTNKSFRAATAISIILDKNIEITREPGFHPCPSRYISLSDVWNHMTDYERSIWACLPFMRCF